MVSLHAIVSVNRTVLESSLELSVIFFLLHSAADRGFGIQRTPLESKGTSMQRSPKNFSATPDSFVFHSLPAFTPSFNPTKIRTTRGGAFSVAPKTCKPSPTYSSIKDIFEEGSISPANRLSFGAALTASGSEQAEYGDDPQSPCCSTSSNDQADNVPLMQDALSTSDVVPPADVMCVSDARSAGHQQSAAAPAEESPSQTPLRMDAAALFSSPAVESPATPAPPSISKPAGVYRSSMQSPMHIDWSHLRPKGHPLVGEEEVKRQIAHLQSKLKGLEGDRDPAEAKDVTVSDTEQSSTETVDAAAAVVSEPVVMEEMPAAPADQIEPAQPSGDINTTSQEEESTIAEGECDKDDVVSRWSVLLGSKTIDWELRRGALVEIRELCKAGGSEREALAVRLLPLTSGLNVQLADLRSKIVKEACLTISVISQTLGPNFAECAEVRNMC